MATFTITHRASGRLITRDAFATMDDARAHMRSIVTLLTHLHDTQLDFTPHATTCIANHVITYDEQSYTIVDPSGCAPTHHIQLTA